MDENLFVKIADEVASEPLFSNLIIDLQNEPLLDNRIFDRVRYFKSIAPKKICSFVTNGQLLDRFNPVDIMESNIDGFVISINAHSKETYNSINLGLDYDRVMANITSLVSDEFLKRRVKLSFVLTEQNVGEVYQATQYWKEQDIRTRVMRLCNRGGSLPNYEGMKIKGKYSGWPLLASIWHRLIYRVPVFVGCHLPFSDMCILYNGDVIICCHDWNRVLIVGNAAENSLREIWNSSRMQQVRQLLMRKRHNELDLCKECNVVRML